MLSTAQLRAVNPVLSEHVRRRSVGGFIADQVFPPLSKPGQTTGQLMVLDDTHLIVSENLVRRPGAPAHLASDVEPSYITYTATRVAAKTVVGNTELQTFTGDPQILVKSRLNKIQDQVLLYRERALASKLNSTSNYDSGFSTTLTTTWASNGGDPQGDITTAIKAVRAVVEPNVFICDNLVWTELERHSALQDILKYTRGQRVSYADFESIFGLRPIIASCRYDASGTISPVWEDGAIVAYVNPSAQGSDAESDMTFGRTVLATEPSVVEWNDDTLDHLGATVYEMEMAYAHQFIGVDNATDGDSIAGYLIDNAI